MNESENKEIEEVVFNYDDWKKIEENDIEMLNEQIEGKLEKKNDEAIGKKKKNGDIIKFTKYDQKQLEELQQKLNKYKICKHPKKCYIKFLNIIGGEIAQAKYNDCPSSHIKRMYEFYNYICNEKIDQNIEDNEQLVNYGDKNEVMNMNIKQMEIIKKVKKKIIFRST